MNKHYCCTDLHGMYNLWRQISEYCDETDTIYFLGDAIDRGKDGLKIMKEMLLDSRVMYLKGNHEDLMGDAVAEVLDASHLDIFYTWMYNGAQDTWKDLAQYSDSSKEWFMNKILAMPNNEVYINPKGQHIFLCHAGTALDYEPWEKTFAGCEGDMYLWDRHHFRKPWSEGYPNWYVVHGHTPVQYLPKLNIMPYETDNEGRPLIKCYADGHKFDLDLGSFVSGTAALFDLDELKVAKYFYIDVKDGRNE